MKRARFEFSTGENIKIAAVWEVIRRILIGIYRRFGGTSCLLLLDKHECRLSLRSWRWRERFSPKRRQITSLHGVTSQKTLCMWHELASAWNRPPFMITPLKVASTQTPKHDFRLPPRNGYELRSSVGYYKASSGNFFSDSWPLKVSPIGFSETSVRNQIYTLRNNKEKPSSQNDEFFCCCICFDRRCTVINYTLLFPLRTAGQWRHKEARHSKTLPVSAW